MSPTEHQTTIFEFLARQEDAETAISAAPDFSAVRFDYIQDELVYSVVDAVGSLMETDYPTARKYWNKLKQRLNEEGSELVTSCHQLKMIASDGKRRETDVMTREQLFRLIQSIPSSKVEQWKVWLAKQGDRAMTRQEDAETAISEAMDTVDYHVGKYRKQGKTDNWIESRVNGIVDRKRFTDALHNAVIDILPSFYAEATELIYKGLWDRTTAQLRTDLEIKRNANPRDHFGEYALIYTRIAEMLATEMLGRAETVSMVMDVDILWKVTNTIKGQIASTEQMLKMDLVSERPLLKSQYDYE